MRGRDALDRPANVIGGAGECADFKSEEKEDEDWDGFGLHCCCLALQWWVGMSVGGTRYNEVNASFINKIKDGDT